MTHVGSWRGLGVEDTPVSLEEGYGDTEEPILENLVGNGYSKDHTDGVTFQRSNRN